MLIGGRSAGGHRVQALDTGVGVVEGQQREQLGDGDAELDLTVDIPAEQVLGGAPGGVGQTFERGELGRLFSGDVAGHPIADHDLNRGRHRGHGGRNRERGALVAPPVAAQTLDGVRGGEQKARDDVPADVHVDELVPEEAVAKQRGERVHVDGAAVHEPEAGRVLHPGVD